MNTIKSVAICVIALFVTITTQAQIENLNLYDYKNMDEAEAIAKFDADYKDSVIVSVYGIQNFFIDNKYAFIENLVTKHRVSPIGFLEYLNAQPMRCGVDMPRTKAPVNPIICKQSKSYTPNAFTKAKLHIVTVLINAGDTATAKTYESCVVANELDVLKLLIDKNGGVFPNIEISGEVMDEACARGNMSFVVYLLDMGVSANSKTKDSFYAIARAVKYPDIFFLLISKGADYNAVGYNKTTPIIHAARVGCLEVVQFFVDKKVDPYVLHGECSAITSAKKYNKVNSKEVIALLKQVKK